VHILVGGLAVLLRWLTWQQAALVAAAAVVFNLVLLPRLSPRVFRSEDANRLIASGIVLYPIAVLGLVLLFPSRLDIVAAAWVILAAGDGFATLVGTHVRSPQLPWNRQKSVAGLVAFVAFGSAAAIAAAWWMDGSRTAALCAAVAAAFVETVPIRLNDNLSVPATAALVLWSFTFTDPATLHASLPIVTPLVLPAIGLNVVVAALGYAARTVTIPGAAAGAAIGTVMFLGAGLFGWLMLFASFLCAAVATRLGHRRKAAAGIAESRGGRRGPGNAIANTGLGAFALAIGLGMPVPALAWLAAVAALATSASDTVASEVGKAWGRTTWLLPSMTRVPPGTTGAISLEGTVAGALSAGLLGWTGAALGLIPAQWIPAVTVAAVVASLIEGWLGARWEAPGILNNDALNFVNSAIGAGLALVWVTRL
jgi:uncharacterized protein (TIGR00297 family)